MVNSFAFFFIVLQLYGLFFEPQYNEIVASNYMSKKTAEVYTLPVTTFLPSFVIAAVSTD